MRLLLLLLITLSFSFAQAQQAKFQKRYWTDSAACFGRSALQTGNGDYVFAGVASIGNVQGVYIIRTDSSGIPVWKKLFRIALSYFYTDIYTLSMEQTLDGGFIVAGTYDYWVGSGNGAPVQDIFVIKLDGSGSPVWLRHIQTNVSVPIHYAYSIHQTSDGGYIIGGTGLYKLDSLGNIQWTNSDYYLKLDETKQLPDGSYVSVTSRYSPSGAGSSDYALIKWGTTGNMTWSKLIGTSGMDIATDFEVTADGGYIITGYTSAASQPADTNILVVRTDSTGNVIWSKVYGGAAFDIANSIEKGTNTYIIGGSTKSFGPPGRNGYLLNIDTAGLLIWSNSYGGNSEEAFIDASPTSDNGVIAIGNFYSSDFKIYVVKTDSSGSSGCLDSGSLTVVTGASVFSNTVTLSPAPNNSINSWVHSLNIKTTGGLAESICPFCTSTTLATISASGATVFCQGGSVTLTASPAVSYAWSSVASTQSITVNAAGSYSVTLTDSNGCTATSPPTVVTVNVPIVPLITSTGQVLTSTAGVAYQWFLNGTNIPGAISQTFTPTQNGNYTVTVTDANGCTATSLPYSFTLGVNDIGGTHIILQPNPATQYVVVDYATNNNNLVLSVFDSYGRLAYSSPLTGMKGQHSWDVKNKPAGMYYYLVSENGKAIATGNLMILK
jgi:hypothetical protein